MATVARGGTIPLYARFYAYAGGPLTDITDLTATILHGSTIIAGPFGTPPIERTGIGSYLLRWQSPSDAILGSYQVRWTGSMLDSPVEGTEFFDILVAGVAQTGNAAVLVSVSDVRSLTDISVNSDQLRRAQAIIEMISGRSATNLSDSDLKWMRLAVAYQAVWMDAHPEVFSTMDVDTINQDGLMVKFRTDREANLVAPLAKAALRRLKQKSPHRSIQVSSVFSRRSHVENWKPIS